MGKLHAGRRSTISAIKHDVLLSKRNGNVVESSNFICGG